MCVCVCGLLAFLLLVFFLFFFVCLNESGQMKVHETGKECWTHSFVCLCII